MSQKKALITGITGQDGSYLAELLLSKGYSVHGIIRRVTLNDPQWRISRINHILSRLTIHSGQIENSGRIMEIFDQIVPDECYHLASQSDVALSFHDEYSTLQTNVTGTLNILKAVRQKAPHCKFYFAASSEMFGLAEETPQTEKTRFHPRSVYAISKVTGFDLTRNYREAYNLFACSGILFNHESPRRGYEFITRKIAREIARIKNGQTNVLVIGNPDSQRDWGFAGDYVKLMWLMLQQNKPIDYIGATGITHSVKDLINFAFKHIGLKYILDDMHHLSEEEADQETEKRKKEKNKIFVIQHPRFYRPSDAPRLQGDPTKAKHELNWQAETSFEQLIRMMIESELNILKK